MCEFHVIVSGTDPDDHKPLSFDLDITFMFIGDEYHMLVQFNDGSGVAQDVLCGDPVNPYTFIEKYIMFNWSECDPHYLIS